MTLYLSKRGANVEVAGNSVEGYQKALKNNYDLVLMDLQMPQMDQYSTLALPIKPSVYSVL